MNFIVLVIYNCKSHYYLFLATEYIQRQHVRLVFMLALKDVIIQLCKEY